MRSVRICSEEDRKMEMSILQNCIRCAYPKSLPEIQCQHMAMEGENVFSTEKRQGRTCYFSGRNSVVTIAQRNEHTLSSMTSFLCL